MAWTAKVQSDLVMKLHTLQREVEQYTWEKYSTRDRHDLRKDWEVDRKFVQDVINKIPTSSKKGKSLKERLGNYLLGASYYTLNLMYTMDAYAAKLLQESGKDKDMLRKLKKILAGMPIGLFRQRELPIPSADYDVEKLQKCFKEAVTKLKKYIDDFENFVADLPSEL